MGGVRFRLKTETKLPVTGATSLPLPFPIALCVFGTTLMDEGASPVGARPGGRTPSLNGVTNLCACAARRRGVMARLSRRRPGAALSGVADVLSVEADAAGSFLEPDMGELNGRGAPTRSGLVLVRGVPRAGFGVGRGWGAARALGFAAGAASDTGSVGEEGPRGRTRETLGLSTCGRADDTCAVLPASSKDALLFPFAPALVGGPAKTSRSLESCEECEDGRGESSVVNLRAREAADGAAAMHAPLPEIRPPNAGGGTASSRLLTRAMVSADGGAMAAPLPEVRPPKAKGEPESLWLTRMMASADGPATWAPLPDVKPPSAGAGFGVQGGDDARVAGTEVCASAGDARSEEARVGGRKAGVAWAAAVLGRGALNAATGAG